MSKNTYPFASVIYGIISDYIGTLFNIILGFIAIPIYIHRLGATEYGLWLALLSTGQLLALIEIPVDQYLMTTSARDAIFNSEEYNSYIGSALFVKILSSTVFLFAAYIAAHFISFAIPSTNVMLPILRQSFVVVTISLTTNNILSYASVVLFSRNHHFIVNTATNIFQITQVLLTLLLIGQGFSFLSFSASMLIISLLQGAFFISCLLFFYPSLVIFHFRATKARCIEAFSYSLKFQNIRYLYVFRTQVLSIFLNRAAGPIALANYNITNRFPQFAPLFSSKLALALFPSISNQFEESNYHNVSKILLSSTKLLARFSLFLGVLIILFNQAFISLWIGPSSFVGNYAQSVIILNLIIMVSMSQFAIIIFASKDFKKWNKFAIVEMFLTIPIVLFYGSSLGLDGILSVFTLFSVPTQICLFQIVTQQLGINRLKLVYNVITYSTLKNVFVLFLFVLFLIASPVISSWLSLLFWVLIFVISAFVIDINRFLRSPHSDITSKLRYAASL